MLPVGVRAHAFGVKGDALPYLAPFSRWIASIDSQAFGVAARRDALRRGVAKSDRLVASHMEQWYQRQCGRALAPPVTLPEAADHQARSLGDDDPWERAIADARAQIRELIETGELDHDQITANWVESWAADLFHQRAA